MRLFLFLLLVFFCSAALHAQEEVVYDRDSLELRSFSNDSIAQFLSDPDFQYEVTAEPATSLWDRFWTRFWNYVDRFLQVPTNKRFVKAAFTTLAFAIMLFFIYRLSGMNNTSLFSKKNTASKSGYLVTDEDIHAIDFDAAIEKAIADNNFRFAVRLLYLQTLKQLSDRNMINWQPNKTNVAYVLELHGSPFQKDFQLLTWQFENNWYGDLPIVKSEFAAVRENFFQFNHQMP